MTAPGPYFGGPSVLMDVYSLGGELGRSGMAQHRRDIQDVAADRPAAVGQQVELRPLDDPTLDPILAKLDRKRHRGTTPERVWLKVPYERKDEAKALGARWAPAEKLCSLPAGRRQRWPRREAGARRRGVAAACLCILPYNSRVPQHEGCSPDAGTAAGDQLSRLTDLIARAKAKDPALGDELEREFKALASRRAFGLNFERHRPGERRTAWTTGPPRGQGPRSATAR